MNNPKITFKEIGIIKRAQAGDETAFSMLFKKYKKFVENLLFQYIKDIDEAKDVTNIVFLKVYNKLSTFVDYESFGGWLRIITNRTAVDYLREMKNKNNVLGNEDEKISSNYQNSSNEIDIINRMTYEQIITLFNKFPENTCKILQMFYVNNMTVEQISNKLKIPTGTIKSTLSRSRKKLKTYLKEKT